MILVVGLGNPGGKYVNTRHNVGFGAVEEFQRENKFPEFKLSKKFQAEISERALEAERVVLAKPQTFMNKSGLAVKALFNFYKLVGHNLIVINDDIDLPLGQIKIGKGRGSAGHKGVESIIKELGSNDFVRIRIGVQPAMPQYKNDENFVLQKFSKQEEKTIQQAIKKTSQAITAIINEGAEKAMNEYNFSKARPAENLKRYKAPAIVDKIG